MRRILPAITLFACVAPRTTVTQPTAVSSASALPSAAPAAPPARKTDGQISVTLFSSNGGVQDDDVVAQKALGACATEVGSARGWLLVRIESNDEGKAKSVQIVERVGLPEGVASCVEGRVRTGYAPATVVYLSVH